MTAKQVLEQVLMELPEDRLGEVLDFARFLSAREEQEAWRQFGRAQLGAHTETMSQIIRKRISNRSLIHEARRRGAGRLLKFQLSEARMPISMGTSVAAAPSSRLPAEPATSQSVSHHWMLRPINSRLTPAWLAAK